MQGSLVRNAPFDAPTCVVSGRWLSSAVAVSIGEAGKHFLFESFTTGCNALMRFCVARVALHAPTCVVSGRWLSSAVAVSIRVSKQVVRLFCVACVALHAPTCVVSGCWLSSAVAVSIG